MSNENCTPKKRITIGFLLVGNSNWKGGVNYQRTLLQIIATSLSDFVVAKVFVSKDQYVIAKEAFGPYLEIPLIIDSRVVGAGVGLKGLKALFIGKDKDIENLFTEHGVDVAFETARFFGRKFSLPCLSWIPDLQHKYLPQFFSFFAWWKREIGFWAQTRFNKKRLVILSSLTAENDCKSFYPHCRNHTHVMRFSPILDVKSIYKKITEVKNKYNITDNYFYLPNHFWAHKNHNLIIDAILIIRKKGLINTLPPIYMSGPIDDTNPAIFNNIMERIELENLGSFFSYIGLIPYEDVLSLNAGSIAILNPSKFEGWSSSVEEAKILGTNMILSDIALHREQSPSAYFFDPEKPLDLAEILLSIPTSNTLIKKNISNSQFYEFSKNFKSAIKLASSFRN